MKTYKLIPLEFQVIDRPGTYYIVKYRKHWYSITSSYIIDATTDKPRLFRDIAEVIEYLNLVNEDYNLTF